MMAVVVSSKPEFIVMTPGIDWQLSRDRPGQADYQSVGRRGDWGGGRQFSHHSPRRWRQAPILATAAPPCPSAVFLVDSITTNSDSLFINTLDKINSENAFAWFTTLRLSVLKNAGFFKPEWNFPDWYETKLTQCKHWKITKLYFSPSPPVTQQTALHYGKLRATRRTFMLGAKIGNLRRFR